MVPRVPEDPTPTGDLMSPRRAAPDPGRPADAAAPGRVAPPLVPGETFADRYVIEKELAGWKTELDDDTSAANLYGLSLVDAIYSIHRKLDFC